MNINIKCGAMAILISDKIYSRLKVDLKKGSIHHNYKLLSEKELSQRYQVAVGTVRKAIGRLIDKGVLERQQGRGTFLLAPLKSKPKKIEKKKKHVPKLRLGNAFISFFQDQIISKLSEDNEANFITETFPYTSSFSPLGSEINNCDMLFFSPFQLFSKQTNETLQPVPSRIREHMSQYFPHVALEVFTIPGTMHLQGIPMLANPVFTYLHSDTFKQNEVELPTDDWNWENCLEVARALKRKKMDDFPIALHPSPGCLYEPLLWYFGGDYFTPEGDPWLPEQALEAMIDLLRTMYSEGLAVNVYKLSVSYTEFVIRKKTPIYFCAPILGGSLPKQLRPEWQIHPFPGSKQSSTPVAIFGAGVPAAAKNPEKIWDRIWELLIDNGGINRLADIHGVFPASYEAMQKWNGGGLRCPEKMIKIIDNSKPVSAVNGLIDWYSEVYEFFDKMACGTVSVKNGREHILSILSKQKRSSFAAFLI